MPSPVANVPLLADLLRAGVIEDIVADVVGRVPPDSDIYTTNVLYDAVLRHTPALLPSTFNALLKRAGGAVAAYWSAHAGEDVQPAALPNIPIAPERRGRAGDYSERIIYRVIVDVPFADGHTEYRTVYIPSQTALTFTQLQEEALAILEVLAQEERQRYPLELPDDASELQIEIDALTRSY